jgi:hypothetical protein
VAKRKKKKPVPRTPRLRPDKRPVECDSPRLFWAAVYSFAAVAGSAVCAGLTWLAYHLSQ